MKIKLSHTDTNTFFYIVRQGMYFFATIAFAYVLKLIASIYKEKTFIEFGIVENLQLILLTICIVTFAFQSRLFKLQSALFLFLSALCGFALIREMDGLFDKLIPFISWKFCYLLPLIAGFNLVKNKKQLKKDLFVFFKTPAFSLMCTAMFVFIPIAQVIGNKTFIGYVVPEGSDLILIRRLIEESAECMAYFLILLSSVEIYFSFKQLKK